MIRSPLGLRINVDPSRSPRDQIREAATLGAKGVVMDAAGDLAPDRLSDTGRRDLRHTLRSVELSLIALSLPTRRPFDSEDGLDQRFERVDRAFALAYELGAKLVLLRAGAVPDETEVSKRTIFVHALTELARRADHRGIRLTIETGSEPGKVLAGIFDTIASPGLAASLDPSSMLLQGHDPIAATSALGTWIAHAYAPDESRSSTRGVKHPRGFGYASGALNWEEYLGALEEIGYRGFLTIWPEPLGDQAGTFREAKTSLDRF